MSTGDPVAIRRALLDELRELVGGDAAFFMRFGRSESEERLRVSSVEATGDPAIAKKVRKLAAAVVSNSALDVLLSVEVNRPGVQRVADYPAEIQLLASALGVDSILVMNASRDGHSVGFFGLLRRDDSAPFDEEAMRLVSRRADAFGDLLRLADRFESRGPAVAVFVLDGARPIYASHHAEVLLSVPGFRDQLLDAMCQTEAGRPASVLGYLLTVTAVEGGGGETKVVELERLESPPTREIHMLTPTQKRVATLLAAGATVAEVSRTLGRSPETTRSHLRAVYTHLGIGSRAELALHVHEAWR